MAFSESLQQNERHADLLFILTVVAAYLSSFLASDRALVAPRSALLLGLGGVFVLLGVRGYDLAWRVHPLAGPLAYFFVQIALAVTILTLSEGAGFLALVFLPIVSQAAGDLPRFWTWAVCAVILVAFAALLGFMTNWIVTMVATSILFVGIAFTVSFTDIAVRQARAHREVAQLAAELRAANQRLREHAAQAEELATMEERNRLAREIHDTLGHYLTAVNVQLEAARAVLENDPDRAMEALENAQSMTKKGLSEVRSSVAALRPSPLEHKTLADAVKGLLDEFGASGLVAEFGLAGEPRPLSPQAQLALYRTAQEGLTNVRRHARASWVRVQLNYDDSERVRLTVEDNGVGADLAEDGFGLLGVRERIRLLGGEVRMETAPREGFKLDVEVPG